MSILDVLLSDVPQLIATSCFIFTLPDVTYGADFRCLFLSTLLGTVLGLYLTQRAYGIEAPRQRLFACLFLLGASILAVISHRFCVSCIDRVHGARALNFAFMFMLAKRVAAIYFPPVQSLALDSHISISRMLYGMFVVVAVTGLVLHTGRKQGEEFVEFNRPMNPIVFTGRTDRRTGYSVEFFGLLNRWNSSPRLRPVPSGLLS